MKKLKQIIAYLLLLLLIIATMIHAQEEQETGIGDTMRSNGRIYVVVAVMLTILIGLIIISGKAGQKDQ